MSEVLDDFVFDRLPGRASELCRGRELTAGVDASQSLWGGAAEVDESGNSEGDEVDHAHGGQVCGGENGEGSR